LNKIVKHATVMKGLPYHASFFRSTEWDLY